MTVHAHPLALSLIPDSHIENPAITNLLGSYLPLTDEQNRSTKE